MIENGASKGEPGAARRARDEWIQQFGRGKVPDLCTFRRNYTKWKTQPTGVLNLHAFVRKVCLIFSDKKSCLPDMAIPVVEFSREEYKIRKVFG